LGRNQDREFRLDGARLGELVPAPKGNKYAKGSGKGRPSLYRPQYAEQAKNLCERGATNGQLARFFNVSVSTIWLWRLAYEEFSNAVQLGKRVADDRIEQALFDWAAGYDYDTVKVFRGEDGKPVISDPYIEHVPPDVGAIKLWLLNRRPDRWKEKVEVTNTGGLIDRSPEEIKRLLVAKMIEWGLVEIENVPPELLPLPDGTVGEE
jgi:hypothetical protein